MGCASNIGPLATAFTDVNGNFVFPPVENVDGTFEGTLDIYAKVYLWSEDPGSVRVSPTASDQYDSKTSVYSNVPDGAFSVGTWGVVGDRRGAVQIYDALLRARDYVLPFGASFAVRAVWPDSGGTYTETNFQIVHFLPGHEWTEDVIVHEYAHALLYQAAYGVAIPNSGGPWNFNQHLNNPSLAFSEGWATFLGVAVNLELGWGDSFYPRDSWVTDPIRPVSIDLETNVPQISGDDVVDTVMQILWDIYDNPNDGRDTLARGFGPVWDVLKNFLTGGHHVYNIREFWDGWFARGNAIVGQTSAQQIWGIYFDHGINMDGTAPTSSVADLPASTRSPFTVTWAGSDGLSGVDNFDVQYRDATAGGSWTDWLTATMATSAVFCNPCPTSQSIEGRAYEFRSRTRDRAGNIEAYPVSFDVRTTIDNTPPTWPAGSSLTYTKKWDTAQSSWKITLTWSPTTANDNIGTVNNLVYFEGTLIATLPATQKSYVDYLPAYDGTATYKIESTDAVGLTSLNGPSVTFYVGCLRGRPCPVSPVSENNPLQRGLVMEHSNPIGVVGVYEILVGDYTFGMPIQTLTQTVEEQFIKGRVT